MILDNPIALRAGYENKNSKHVTVRYFDQAEIITGRMMPGEDETILYIDRCTNLLDSKKNLIYERDRFWGLKGYVKSDGYKRKDYPDQVRVLLEVYYESGRYAKPGFYLKEIEIHPEDKFATEIYQYRWLNYSSSLTESRSQFLKNNKVEWKGCCERIEITSSAHER